MNEMAIISVDYKELNPTTYRGVTVSLDREIVYRCRTGNFNNDYRNAVAFAQELSTNLMSSSSVGNFIQDCKALLSDKD